MESVKGGGGGSPTPPGGVKTSADTTDKGDGADGANGGNTKVKPVPTNSLARTD